MSSREIWLVGAGGHARVIADLLQRKGTPAAGCIDPNVSQEAKAKIPLPVQESHEGLATDRVKLINAIGSVSKDSLIKRRQVFECYRSMGFVFDAVVDPTAVLAGHTQLGMGSQIHMGACLQVGVRVGENSIINTRASIDHDCLIGNHVHVAPGVTLSGSVHVEDEVHIGTGAVVIQGIKIGRGALIAAGAVVVRDVLPGEIIKGVPGVKNV